jgi:hypothetical protein
MLRKRTENSLRGGAGSLRRKRVLVVHCLEQGYPSCGTSHKNGPISILPRGRRMRNDILAHEALRT